MNIEENDDFISIYNDLLNFITDFDSNLFMKETFGICPVELASFIIKYKNYKL